MGEAEIRRRFLVRSTLGSTSGVLQSTAKLKRPQALCKRATAVGGT